MVWNFRCILFSLRFSTWLHGRNVSLHWIRCGAAWRGVAWCGVARYDIDSTPFAHSVFLLCVTARQISNYAFQNYCWKQQMAPTEQWKWYNHNMYHTQKIRWEAYRTPVVMNWSNYTTEPFLHLQIGMIDSQCVKKC